MLHVDSPLLVSAGAGSGKTRVITYKIAHLIYDLGIDPASILAVTFTNKAANEMRERVFKLLRSSDLQLTVSTFHSFCARFLRRHAPVVGLSSSFSIADVAEQERIMKRVMEKLNATGTASKWRSAVSRCKEAGRSVEDVLSDHQSGLSQTLGPLFQAYQKALLEQQSVDFDDLLLFSVQILKRNSNILTRYRESFSYILIDEYQDTNYLQFELVRLLAGASGKGLCVVGDEDQSIYGWRGASIDHIRRFENDFPKAKVILLEDNYRSTGHILAGASSLIGRNRNRYSKTLRTSQAAGQPIVYKEADDQKNEVDFVIQEIRHLIPAGEAPTAILYRANYMSRAFEDGLVRSGLKYKIVGSLRFYERREIKDLSSYLRLLANPMDVQAFVRAANVPPRKGLGSKSIDSVIEWAHNHHLDLPAAAAQAITQCRLTSAANAALRDFLGIMKQLSTLSTDTISPLLETVFAATSYEDYLKRAGSPEEATDRLANVHEFIEAGREFDEEKRGTLLEFLDSISLTTGQDDLDNSAPVLLMTIHCAKGLEFPVVFLVNMNENAFPLSHAIYNNEELEEERRLCYVGMTRAMRRLYLTSDGTRMPSRFLREIEPSGAMVSHLSNPESHELFPRPQIQNYSLGRKEAPRRSSQHPFRPSDRVIHPKFGTGSVLRIEGDGETAVVSVAFDLHGVKRLVLGFAKLTKA